MGPLVCALREGVLSEFDRGLPPQNLPAMRRNGPGAVSSDIKIDDATRIKLAENRPPRLCADIAAHTEGRQTVMVDLLDAVCRLAAKERDQMLGAEALAGPGDGGERFLREDRAVGSSTPSTHRSQLPQGPALSPK